MSKKLLSQREIAVIKHVWSLSCTEGEWLDKFKLMRSTVGEICLAIRENKLKLDDQLFTVSWTVDRKGVDPNTPVLLSFRAHYNSRTQIVLCHIVQSQLSCKSIDLPEYES